MVLNIPCATIAVSRALKAEEITGLSNVCYTLHNGALRVWKRIELHGTQMRAWLVTYAGLEEDKIA